MDTGRQQIRDAMLTFIERCVKAAGVSSPSQLATEADLAPSTLNRFIKEKKGKPPKHLLSTSTLNKISQVSGLPLPLLFDDAEFKISEPNLELNGSDHAMARVVEDLIVVLMRKKLIKLKDLPKPARSLMDRRRQLRAARGGSNDD